ncbi:caspase family protein [Roseibium sp.]|uniref:caspase family protein n=1 Tax=Roseibium sp. TaxID=1936156 RepID=UPI003264D33C
MTKRVCICVGVTNHEDARLSQLKGAEVDAKNFFAALTDPGKGGYDADASVLLLDPKKNDVAAAVADLAYGDSVESFTFFFAGHGGVSNEAFALCCSDTNCSRFIATALPITEIFQILNDAKPRHSNLIIDACQAAGMVADLGSLLKPSQMGRAQGASISIFASSAADRGAGETDEGGIGTRFVLDCIDGRKDCRVAKDYLSLDDIGAAVSSKFGDQSPSVWSFNVSGASQFVRNPKAVDSQNGEFARLPKFGSSDLPTLDLVLAERLWRTYVDASDEVDIREIQQLLENAVSGLDDSGDQAGLIVGLSESFASRGAISDDSFASVEILCAFLFAAQAIEDRTVRKEVVNYLIIQIDCGLSNALGDLESALGEDFGLLAKGGAYSEFFALPIRISKVAAWSLTSLLFAENDGAELARRTVQVSNVLECLRAVYATSFTLMSEEQAPFILVVSELAEKFGMAEWSEEYISTLYADYFSIDRKVAKVGLPDERVLSFLRWRCGDNSLDAADYIAKPTELVFVLLYHFLARGQLDVIRYDFADLDHTIVSTFVPDCYERFSEEIIDDGINIQFHIGFDVFTANEFKDFVQDHMLPAIQNAVSGSNRIDLQTALFASLIYPDRMPWFLANSESDDV